MRGEENASEDRVQRSLHWSNKMNAEMRAIAIDLIVDKVHYALKIGLAGLVGGLEEERSPRMR